MIRPRIDETIACLDRHQVGRRRTGTRGSGCFSWVGRRASPSVHRLVGQAFRTSDRGRRASQVLDRASQEQLATPSPSFSVGRRRRSLFRSPGPAIMTPDPPPPLPPPHFRHPRARRSIRRQSSHRPSPTALRTPSPQARARRTGLLVGVAAAAVAAGALAFLLRFRRRSRQPLVPAVTRRRPARRRPPRQSHAVRMPRS